MSTIYDASLYGGKGRENILVLELRSALDSPLEIQRLARRSFQHLLRRFLPRDPLLQKILLRIRKETDINKHPHEFRKTLESQSPSDDSGGFRDGVALFIWSGVTVGVGNEGKAGVGGVVLFRCAHELRTGDVDDFIILIVFGGVAEGEKDATAGPGEFIAWERGLASELKGRGKEIG